MLAVLLSLLIASAAASPVTLVEYGKRDLAVTDAVVADLDFFAQYTTAAYCNFETPAGTVVTCKDDACPDVEANGATIVTSFLGHISGLGGFVAVDPVRSTIVMSFKGSNSLRNWLEDLQLLFVDCDLADDCQVHQGFLNAWEEVREEVLAGVGAARAANPGFTLTATGHSLGGAVATFAAASMRAAANGTIDIYSYGSPRVGNDVLADLITAQAPAMGLEFRVTHVDDPVPRLPPLLLGYRHTSPELWLSTGSADTIDYSTADVKVCTGNDNLSCNGGTIGIDVDAHGNYLRDMGACAGVFSFR